MRRARRVSTAPPPNRSRLLRHRHGLVDGANAAPSLAARSQSVDPAPGETTHSGLDSSVRKPAVKGLVGAGVAAGLAGLTYLLLPSPVGFPAASPGGSDAVDDQSVVALVTTPYGGRESFYSADLRWDWSASNGSAKPSFVAHVSLRRATGSLLLGGPIAHALSSCILNGEPVRPASGLPAHLGFTLPHDVAFSFDSRSPGTVARIDFTQDPGPGGTVIVCSAEGFAADDAPIHRTYTPDLLAYASGTESASSRELELATVCVSAGGLDSSTTQEVCAEQNQVVARAYQRDDLTILPEEQARRDARLALVGAVAGVAAASVLNLVPQVISLLIAATRSLLSRRRPA